MVDPLLYWPLVIEVGALPQPALLPAALVHVPDAQ
jgi:hypothetical protein